MFLGVGKVGRAERTWGEVVVAFEQVDLSMAKLSPTKLSKLFSSVNNVDLRQRVTVEVEALQLQRDRKSVANESKSIGLR